MGTVLVGRPKKRTAASGSPEPKTIGFRVSGEYGVWLEKLAERHRTTVAGILDRAVAEWAETNGFEDPAPVRLP